MNRADWPAHVAGEILGGSDAGTLATGITWRFAHFDRDELDTVAREDWLVGGYDVFRLLIVGRVAAKVIRPTNVSGLLALEDLVSYAIEKADRRVAIWARSVDRWHRTDTQQKEETQ